MMGQLECGECGKACLARDPQGRCEACATRAAIATGSLKRCSGCQEACPRDWKFCGFCGRAFGVPPDSELRGGV
jgi:hypothetical protein